jgi:exopolyphosphatase/guanosine-5'-triphosphate,3'-diphosphate pyrophosphatase
MPGPMHSNWQSLSAEDKRVVLLLIPLLRLADNLDVSHEARIQSLSCRIRDGEVLLQVSSSADISLEQWAAERTSEVFRQVYNRAIATQKVQADAVHS